MMQTEITKGAWTVRTDDDEEHVVPFDAVPYRALGVGPTPEIFADFVPCGTPLAIEAHPWAFIARLSMPGYLDATEWCGPYTSAREALADVWTQHGCPACGSDDVGREGDTWKCAACQHAEGVR